MKVNTISLNSVRLNTIALNHIGEIRSGGGASKPSPIPQWIREHVVFYYDVKKQGATNETLKESAYLQDLSGKGRRMKLNNFLFAEMSGVGGYNDNFLKWNSPSSYGNVEKVSSSEVVIKSLLGVQKGVLYIDLSIKAVNIRCHITGITKEIEGKFVFQYNKQGNKHIILKDGDFEFDSESLSLGSENGWVGFTTLEVIDNCNITITQIPEYPGAVVTDGVDDYGLVENLSSGVKMLFMTVNPIGDYNSRKDYYSQIKKYGDDFRVIAYPNDIAYNHENPNNVTYINGVLNKSIYPEELFDIKHTFTIVNNAVPLSEDRTCVFFRYNLDGDYYSRIAFYNSIAFDSIPTEADGFTEQELIDYVLTNIIGQ
ncbi:hypothetical protein [Phocaeicola massiliensis]|uniref:hypothetical protein n=1 Tax=Phocaeicola massiliensis TaxID=204516 RepID=UPI0032EC68B9